MKAMILAAGLGERLRPLTDKTPKPLLKVAGKPLIQYHIEALVSAGIREIVINTSWLGEQIESFVGDGGRFGAQVFWSREESPLETGGGIRRALPLLGNEPFLLINGDVWSDFSISSLVAREWSSDMDAHLVMVPNPTHNAEGDFTLDERGIVSYAEQADETLTFSGVSVMRPEIFALYSAASEKFPLRNVLESGIRAGCVSGEVFRGVWWDVGTLERFEALNALMNSREVDPEQKPGVRLN